MSDGPAPLVPAECVMTGNEWFPFYFDRLRKSKWWRRASDLARARNVMMWGEAFKAMPAGSLPDDDDELAEAAGYGMDVEAFLSVKADIMAPWTLCSDGRWYHPTVCEVVIDAWERTSDRRKAAADRQRKRRDKVRNGSGNSEAVTPPDQHVTPETTPVTRDTPDVTRDFGIQDRTGQDSREAVASLSLTSDDEPVAKPEYPPDFDACWKAYPHVRGRSSKSKSLAAWRRIPQARRILLPSAIDRYRRDGREPNSECGAPAMERWLRDERYRDWLDESPAVPTRPAWSGPPEVSAAIDRHGDADRLRSFLSGCSWRDLPDRAILCPNRFIADALTRAIGREMQGVGITILLNASDRPAA